MARTRRWRRTIDLPWERSTDLSGGLALLRRWRLGVLLALPIVISVGVWKVAERDAKTRATRAAIAEVRRAALAFRADVGRCPRSTVELVHPPRTGVSYLNDLPPDGWGRALWIRCPAHDDVNDVDIISAGPRGSFFDEENIP